MKTDKSILLPFWTLRRVEYASCFLIVFRGLISGQRFIRFLRQHLSFECVVGICSGKFNTNTAADFFFWCNKSNEMVIAYTRYATYCFALPLHWPSCYNKYCVLVFVLSIWMYLFSLHKNKSVYLHLWPFADLAFSGKLCVCITVKWGFFSEKSYYQLKDTQKQLIQEKSNQI